MTMERILLCKPRMTGHEIDFIKDALADDWATPLGPDCDAFEAAEPLTENRFPWLMHGNS